MPRYKLLDGLGFVYSLDTTSRDRFEQWMHEWIPRLADQRIGLRMQVQPLFSSDTKPDWSIDARFICEVFPVSSTPDAAVKDVDNRRQWIDQEVERLNDRDRRPYTMPE